MNKNDMIKYAAIAGGAYLVYWYLTNYGPNGAVTAANPVSYWSNWFGAATTPATAPAAAPVAAGIPATTPGPVTGPVTQATLQPVLTQPSAPAITPPVNTQIRQQILTASASAPPGSINGGYAVPDVWSYYWQQITHVTITPQQMGQMFPPTSSGTGAPLNLDQFLAKLPSAGLAGIGAVGAVVTVPSTPSLPSMSFGGSFRKPGMRGMGGRGTGNPGMGGTTIQ